MGKRLGVLILLISLFVSSATAVAQDAISIDQLTAKATVAGVAKVQSRTVRRDPANQVIYTDYVLQFSDVWLGSPSEPYILSRTGGRIGDRAASLPGHDYELRDGESIVVFAHPTPQGNNVVIGMHQGLFQIAGGSDPVVQRVLAPPSERKTRLTLEGLKEQVYRASGRPWRASATPTIPQEGRAYGAAATTPVPAMPPAPPEPVRPPPPPRDESGNPLGAILAGVLIMVIAAFILIRKLRASSDSR